MVFYGTPNSIEGWRKVLNKELGLQLSSYLIQQGDRATLAVDLSDEQRQQLQENVWYRAEPDAPRDAQGRPFPWNCRISFKE